MFNNPKDHRIGTKATASILTKSATSITRRFIQRSTKAPASKPKIKKAEVSAAVSKPISHSVAPRKVTAITGMAIPEI